MRKNENECTIWNVNKWKSGGIVINFCICQSKVWVSESLSDIKIPLHDVNPYLPLSRQLLPAAQHAITLNSWHLSHELKLEPQDRLNVPDTCSL